MFLYARTLTLSAKARNRHLGLECDGLSPHFNQPGRSKQKPRLRGVFVSIVVCRIYFIPSTRPIAPSDCAS